MSTGYDRVNQPPNMVEMLGSKHRNPGPTCATPVRFVGKNRIPQVRTRSQFRGGRWRFLEGKWVGGDGWGCECVFFYTPPNKNHGGLERQLEPMWWGFLVRKNVSLRRFCQNVPPNCFISEHLSSESFEWNSSLFLHDTVDGRSVAISFVFLHLILD